MIGAMEDNLDTAQMLEQVQVEVPQMQVMITHSTMAITIRAQGRQVAMVKMPLQAMVRETYLV